MFKKLRIILSPFISTPFTHKPEDFKIKLESWGGSNLELFYVIYSANGGVSWKYVHTAQAPFFNSVNYDWSWRRWVGNQNRNDLETVKELFTSYQAILDYEAEQREMMRIGQIEHKAMQAEHEKKINDRYKEFEI